LIRYKPDQEGNKLIFLSEWHEIPFGALFCRALLEDYWAQTALGLRELVGYTGVLINP